MELSLTRLYLLRALYLLMAVGLGMTFGPLIVAPPDTVANASTAIRALLGALGLLALLGVRYPVRMIPVLLFELLWKIIWVVAFALPVWRHGALDAYASETLFACLMGIVLVPLVLPWGHVVRHYLQARGDRWRNNGPAASDGSRLSP